MIEFSTSDLCDQFGEQVQVLPPLFRSFGGRAACCGPASTVLCDRDNSRLAEAVGEPGRGRVLVVDAAGQLATALLGDRLATQAGGNGWAGAIIHGCVRDVEALAAFDFAVFALVPLPRRSRREGSGRRDVELTLGGVRIRPGAWVYADRDGILLAAGNLLG